MNDTHSIWESHALAHIFLTGKLQNLFLLKEKLSFILFGNLKQCSSLVLLSCCAIKSSSIYSDFDKY